MDGRAWVMKNGKTGCINEHNQWVVRPKYMPLEEVGSFAPNGLAKFKYNNHWGYIDKNGDVIIKAQFWKAEDFNQYGFARVKIHRTMYDSVEWDLIDANGQFVVDPYRKLVYTNGKCGIEDKDGNIVIEPIFNYIEEIDGNGIAVGTISKPATKDYFRDNKFVYIDLKNYTVTEPLYDINYIRGYDILASITCEDEYLNISDLAYVQRGKKCGYIDSNGKPIIEVKYDDLGDFKYGLARATTDSVTGFINEKGHYVIEPIFRITSDFNQHGFALASPDGHTFGMIDKSGNYVIEPIFDLDHSLDGFDKYGLMVVESDWQKGLISNKGHIVHEATFDEIDEFNSRGIAVVELDGKYGLINTQGKLILEPIFDEIDDFGYNGIATVRLDERYGLINDDGIVVIEPTFDNIESSGNHRQAVAWRDGECFFIDKASTPIEATQHRIEKPDTYGLILIEQNGKFGIANKKGKAIITPEYNNIGIFNEYGLAHAVKDDEEVLIDTKGQIILSEEHLFAQEHLQSFKTNGKYGFIDNNNYFVIEPKYDDFNYVYIKTYIFIATKINGKWGLIDRNGNILIKHIFDDVEYNGGIFYSAFCFDEYDLLRVKCGEQSHYINRLGFFSVPIGYKENDTAPCWTYMNDTELKNNKDNVIAYIDNVDGKEILKNGDGDILQSKAQEKPIVGGIVGNLGLLSVIWLIVLVINQVLFFGACFAPYCIMAAIPHTSIIALIITFFIKRK